VLLPTRAASSLILHALDAIGTERLAGFAVETLRIGLLGTFDRLGTPWRLRCLYLRSRLGRRRWVRTGRSRRRGLSKRRARTERAHHGGDQHLSHVTTLDGNPRRD
jgi:hypothetical protein